MPVDYDWDVQRERLPVDPYGYRMKTGATVDDQRREAERYARLSGERPSYQECGSCGAYHPTWFHGDCRADLYRINDPDELHGSDGWDEVPPEPEDVACPSCGGDGVGREGPGACSYCDGSGVVPSDEAERMRDLIVSLGREPLA